MKPDRSNFNYYPGDARKEKLNQMSKTFSRKAGFAGSVVVAALIIAGCGGSSSSDTVEIQDAWARTTAPGQTMGAVYMEIESPDGDQITAASVPSSIAGKTELHETRDAKGCEEGGMGAGHSMKMDGEDSMDMEGGNSMKMDGEGSMDMDSMKCMKEVKSIDLPAGETVDLEPGGYHVMLLDLAKPIKEGETFEVTLSFSTGDDVVAEVTARDEE